MLVVADTGPPHYLSLIGHIDILPRLFRRVILPNVVRDELHHPQAPALVRGWVANPPAWVDLVPTPLSDGPLKHWKIGPGERAAIAVALYRRAELVLIDDRQAVAAAEAFGLRVVGTLGILDRAARRPRRGIGETSGHQFSCSP